MDGRRLELRHVLDQAEKWLLNVALADGVNVAVQQVTEDVETIRKLRTRAASSLINVAFLGGFSSGKSFLIGGLQDRLEYAPVIDEDGMTFDQYIGLLHSAAKATTACPATVVPVDSSIDVDAKGRGFFRAKFVGESRWMDIGNSPMPAVVAAYTTQDQRAIAQARPAQYRDQTVAEIEILLADPPLPAKLYDLPGTGSLHPIHDEIANNAWADADCFLFVTQATSTLSRLDLELINRLYSHHANSGKKVIWVMTGIDRAAMANYEGRPEWKDALEQNNAYLRENFPAPPGQIDTFIGVDGFIPVSPAWEAVGAWHRARGEAAKGEKLIAASQMARLRRALTDLIDAGTGHRHLVTVAVEARTLLAPHHRMLSELLESARLPLARLAGERDDLSRRLKNLKAALEAVREQLEGALRDHVRRVDRGFRGLPEHLHRELDKQIRAADLTRDREANRIEVRRTQVLQEWITQRDGSPQRIWETEFKDFTDGTLTSIRAALRDTVHPDGLGEITARVDVDELTVSPSQRYRTSSQDVMRVVSGFVGLSTPLAGAVAASAGLLSGPLLALPAGVTLLAGVIYAGIRRQRSRATALSVLRQEWIDGLDQVAQDYREAFVAAAGVRGTEVIDRAIELLSERRDELSRKIILVETRLDEPENADKSALVATLEPHCRQGDLLLRGLDNLVQGRAGR